MADKVKKEPRLDLEVTRHEPVKVDDKGRITLHKDVADALGTDVILVIDASEVIRMYPTVQFSVARAKVSSRVSEDNENAKQYLRAAYSNARQVDIDSANRISIPADLRKLMGVAQKDEVVVIANGRDFTIMSKSSYELFIKSPIDFKKNERDQLEQLRKKAFVEEEELRALEKLLVQG